MNRQHPEVYPIPANFNIEIGGVGGHWVQAPGSQASDPRLRFDTAGLEFVTARADFAFETTLSGRGYVPVLRKLKSAKG
jgi:hypothetical protein